MGTVLVDEVRATKSKMFYTSSIHNNLLSDASLYFLTDSVVSSSGCGLFIPAPLVMLSELVTVAALNALNKLVVRFEIMLLAGAATEEVVGEEETTG